MHAKSNIISREVGSRPSVIYPPDTEKRVMVANHPSDVRTALFNHVVWLALDAGWFYV